MACFRVGKERMSSLATPSSSVSAEIQTQDKKRINAVIYRLGKENMKLKYYCRWGKYTQHNKNPPGNKMNPPRLQVKSHSEIVRNSVDCFYIGISV